MMEACGAKTASTMSTASTPRKESKSMTVVYGLANSKGGVGKTTSVVQLAHEAAMQGKKVLVIDGDSQRSLTKYLGMEPKPGQPTIYALMTEPAKGIQHSVRSYTGTAQRPIQYPGAGRLDLIPGAKQIAEAPTAFDRSRDRQPVASFEQVLPYVIGAFCQEYDLVLLDSSPSEDRITEALRYAADRVIAPVASEIMALDGSQELLETLQLSNERRAGLQLPGQTTLHGMLIAKVMPDQLQLVRDLQQTLDENQIPHFGASYVPYTSAGWQAPGDHLPIAVFQPDDSAAAVYHVIAATM